MQDPFAEPRRRIIACRSKDEASDLAICLREAGYATGVQTDPFGFCYWHVVVYYLDGEQGRLPEGIQDGPRSGFMETKQVQLDPMRILTNPYEETQPCAPPGAARLNLKDEIP